jgi:hypothetical protein
MVKKKKNLKLRYFGTRLSGRTKSKLELGTDPGLPGAPQACRLRQPVYVDDTMSDEYQAFFKPDRPYRSIISIPIPLHDESEPVLGVVNIDSDAPHQFRSQDFIGKKIIPAVSPFISLMWLQKDDFT